MLIKSHRKLYLWKRVCAKLNKKLLQILKYHHLFIECMLCTRQGLKCVTCSYSFSLTKTLKGSGFYGSHFTDEKPAQRVPGKYLWHMHDLCSHPAGCTASQDTGGRCMVSMRNSKQYFPIRTIIKLA